MSLLDKPVRGWNHIVFEGYCMRHVSCKKDKYNYKIIDTETFKTEKVDNPYYDPEYKVPKKPKYCKKRVCYTCFQNDCPHLGIAEPPKKEYKKIMKKINELYKDD